jgi:hypothetical protein
LSCANTTSAAAASDAGSPTDGSAGIEIDASPLPKTKKKAKLESQAERLRDHVQMDCMKAG